LADITPLIISYPNFILGQIIDPEEFDQNNMEVVNKVNEIVNVTNENTNAVIVLPEIEAKVDNAIVIANTKADKSYVDGLAADFVLGTIPDASLTAAKLAFDVATTARFVIGTSTSGWTSADCDYLCDGTADDVEINAAIIALPATGGEIVILDGTYNITAKINVTKDNVSIRGNGNATILKRMFDSPVTEGVITLTSRSGCKIANLQIDGNYTDNNGCGIYLYNSSNNTVTSNTCNNNGFGIYLYNSSDNAVTGNTCKYNSFGIHLSSSNNNNTVTSNTCNNNSNHGIYLSSSSNNTVTGNICNNNSNYGIRLFSSSNNAITGNTCNNNGSGIYLYNSSDNAVTGNTCKYNSFGIHLSASNNNNTVTSNTCNNNNFGIYLYNLSNNNTVTSNTCNNNSNHGIYLSSSSNNTVTGNTCNNNGSGIYLVSSSNNNTITGNTCIRGTGTTGDYTIDQYTILLSGTDNNYNLISSNNCMGKAVVIGGGTSNTEVNNKYQ